VVRRSAQARRPGPGRSDRALRPVSNRSQRQTKTPATTTDKPHAGRIALVTGAARGIGQAIAVGLARQGATVVIGNVGDLAETSELIAKVGHPAVTARLDISDPAVVDGVRERVADELGRVDILVKNAANFESATWDDLDFALW
jgi:NAD(P)-dependent dehydrogenase (short-subunit alcohol dehydrogenase family)